MENENHLNSHSWLDELPEPILQEILCLLPMKDAIRTSVLSRRWKYLWTRMHKFNINDMEFSDVKKAQLADTMKRAFAFRDSCDSPSLWSLTVTSMLLYLDHLAVLVSWINASTRYNVQQLVLTLHNHINQPFWYELPSSATLTQLYITCIPNCFIKLPSSFCLPKLRFLSMKRAVFEDDISVQELFSLPKLERLEMDGCCFLDLKAVHITAPNLRWLFIVESLCLNVLHKCPMRIMCNNLEFLLYVGKHFKNYSVSAPSLQAAHICVLDTYENEQERVETAFCLYELLKEYPSIEYLLFSRKTFEVLSSRIELIYRLPLFQNVCKLTMHQCGINFNCKAFWEILRRLPCLEFLHLDETGLFTKCVINADILKPIPSCFQSHLRKIVVSRFRASQVALFLTSIILSIATVLEEMVLHLICTEETPNGREHRKEILSYFNDVPLGSQQCKLVIHCE